VHTYFIGPWELSRATAHLPATPSEGRVLLVESTSRHAALPYHRWKLVLELSALRHFAAELRAEGFEVDHRVAESYRAGIEAHAREFEPERVHLQEPAEWGTSASLLGMESGNGEQETGTRELGLVPRAPTGYSVLADRRFLTSRKVFRKWASGRRLFRMEDFYRWQRKRLGILMEKDAEPVGGEWNLDRENREGARALKRRGLPPEPLAFAPDEITREVMQEIEGHHTGYGAAGTRHSHWGRVEGFDLPVTRAHALAALEDFLEHRLAEFGPYEDAMLAGRTYLYHSRLSAAMNIGLLHPREMVDAAIKCWRRGRAKIPLQSLEGFVRQIIGWREYVNGIYWLRMPSYRDENYFGFTRPLPRLYWEPERTDLACLRDSVRMVRDTAYAHHIHRLMVLANFATLAGVNPLRLSEWFWAGFSDAMEWVELPNVVGMATFGDGGLLASKPYISGAAYINRMSDYCAGCRFNPKARTGPDACPFNYLYWAFLDDIRRRKLDVGRRMALALRQADRLPAAELAAMRAERERFLTQLEPENSGWTFAYDQG
jgi:deoxyribodipyrimidine photolyase-related protein